ncbi:hypothetical protein PHACT_14580 [Pseudohongiella acticola]|jgi:hypothetical protein|uniref:VWA domain-containing protein n=1 Tax=Pseudohongiella acticola TaxID=1524254 RepID=A0A1E8CF44_9GAMM|nr:hypothetical protein [Pseudohongiella acticola]OFE11084.1 hypothetical protein PHACT_14580 [Pseudohongiella acticola]
MKDIKKLFRTGHKSDEKPDSDARAVSARPEIDAFLQKVAAMPPVQPGNAAGRLVFALDATGSREATWDQAMQLQADMFNSAQALGGLQVQLCYFRGVADFYASEWYLESTPLLNTMTGIRCHAGMTKIEQLLDHVKAETRQSRVHAVVYIGDCMEESLDLLCQRAGELGLLNVPLFMFQEGTDPTARRCFVEMARLSGGAYSPFDNSSAGQLRDLLKAVAVYASGGLKALQDFSKKAHPAVKLLGHQLSR